MMAAYSSTQLMTNAMTVLMSSFSNMTTLSTALYAGDFETIGKSTGDIFFTLLGNEEIAKALSAEGKEEKEAFEEKVAKSQAAFDEINIQQQSMHEMVEKIRNGTWHPHM
jgi:hypothetical protein